MPVTLAAPSATTLTTPPMTQRDRDEHDDRDQQLPGQGASSSSLRAMTLGCGTRDPVARAAPPSPRRAGARSRREAPATVQECVQSTFSPSRGDSRMSVTDDRLQRMRPSGRAASATSTPDRPAPGPRWPALLQTIALVRFRHQFVPAHAQEVRRRLHRPDAARRVGRWCSSPGPSTPRRSSPATRRCSTPARATPSSARSWGSTRCCSRTRPSTSGPASC